MSELETLSIKTMGLARPHPCLGWLFLNGQDHRYCFNKLIEMRDQQMKEGTYSSGLPDGYMEWALEDLKRLAQMPQYKKRIEEHLSQLNLSISNREKELNQTYLAEELAKMKSRKELIESVL